MRALPPVSLKSARAAQRVIAALSKGFDQLSGVRRRVLRFACGWRQLSTLLSRHAKVSHLAVPPFQLVGTTGCLQALHYCVRTPQLGSGTVSISGSKAWSWFLEFDLLFAEGRNQPACE